MLWWFYTKKLGTCDKKKLVNKIWSTKSGRAAAITPRDGVNSFMLRTKLRTFIKLLCFPSIRHFFFFCQRTKRTECQTSIMKSLTSCALLWSHPNPWRDCGLAISRLLLPPFMQKLKKKKKQKKWEIYLVDSICCILWSNTIDFSSFSLFLDCEPAFGATTFFNLIFSE